MYLFFAFELSKDAQTESRLDVRERLTFLRQRSFMYNSWVVGGRNKGRGAVTSDVTSEEAKRQADILEIMGRRRR